MNAVTDLPAEATSPAIDLQRVDLQDVALARFGPWRADVARVRQELGSLVLDLSIPARIAEAKSLRERLINQPRANVRAVSKALKAKLAQVSRAVGAEEEAAVAAYTEAEQLISPQIEAREAEIRAEKEARRAAEAARIQKHRDAIATIRAYLDRCKAPGMTAERIERGIEVLRAVSIGPAFEEFQDEAHAARAQTLQAMEALRSEAQAREEQEAYLNALRVEQERQAAELAEQRRQIEEAAAAVAREKAELEAARQRIAEATAADATEPAPPAAAATQEPEATPPGGRDLADAADAAPCLRIDPSQAPVYVPSEHYQGQPDDEAPPAGTDLELAAMALTAHIAEAFASRFPTQPKMEPGWWARLRVLARQVEAVINDEVLPC